MLSKHLLIILLQLASAGGDAFLTNQGLNNGNHELNSLAKPFVHNTTGRVLYFSGTTTIHIITPYFLRKKHHNKLANIAEAEGILDNSYGVVSSLILK